MGIGVGLSDQGTADDRVPVPLPSPSLCQPATTLEPRVFPPAASELAPESVREFSPTTEFGEGSDSAGPAAKEDGPAFTPVPAPLWPFCQPATIELPRVFIGAVSEVPSGSALVSSPPT